LALGASVGPPPPLHRLAQPAIARLAAWIRARLGRGIRAVSPVGLLGLGPGLTPSGDDLLCGALIACNAIGRGDAARDLHAGLQEAPAGATSALSWALLGAAAEGQGGESLHELLNAVLQDRPFDLALAALASHGHTSGWDTLAGVAVALSAARPSLGARFVDAGPAEYATTPEVLVAPGNGDCEPRPLAPHPEH
jgi:Protein of unknown function (DUF2877)